MKRLERGIATALKVSRLSDYRRINIGAAIYRGNKLLSVGCNKSQTHPFQLRYDYACGKMHSKGRLHAEICAILNGGCLENSVMYIAREQRDGEMGMCRPCESCIRAIKDAGIKKIIYTTKTGIGQERYV